MEHSGKYAAEFIGTFWLTFGGCGAAVLSSAFPEVGIGLSQINMVLAFLLLAFVIAVGPTPPIWCQMC